MKPSEEQKQLKLKKEYSKESEIQELLDGGAVWNEKARTLEYQGLTIHLNFNQHDSFKRYFKVKVEPEPLLILQPSHQSYSLATAKKLVEQSGYDWVNDKNTDIHKGGIKYSVY